jgi:hypothetical protein
LNPFLAGLCVVAVVVIVEVMLSALRGAQTATV